MIGSSVALLTMIQVTVDNVDMISYRTTEHHCIIHHVSLCAKILKIQTCDGLRCQSVNFIMSKRYEPFLKAVAEYGS